MMTSTTKAKFSVPGWAAKLLTAVFWLCVWQAVYLCVGQEILVVSPACVLQRLFQLGAEQKFWLTVLRSILRILSGFFIGMALGILLAVPAACSKTCRTLIRPVVSVIKATPVASFIIIALVWMHAEFVPAFSASLIVFPVVWENVLEGIQKTDVGLLQMSRMFCFGPAKTARCVYLPSVMPYFTAACTTSLGLSWKSGVAAEVLANLPFSIGGFIYDSKIYLETADLFAWTAVVILLSVLLEHLVTRLMKRAAKKFSFEL